MGWSSLYSHKDRLYMARVGGDVRSRRNSGPLLALAKYCRLARAVLIICWSLVNHSTCDAIQLSSLIAEAELLVLSAFNE
eukprot:6205279-Pleurochrysis_carterae.AAC.1